MRTRTTTGTLALQRRILQIAVALGGIVPVAAGLGGILMGTGMIDAGGTSVSLDSHFRYMSGLLLAIGLGFWSTIPRIETQGARFRLLAVVVFIGGLGRMTALLTEGMPDHGMLLGLGMEVIVTPVMAVWQFHIQSRWLRKKS